QPAERQFLTITSPVEVRDGSSTLIASPPTADEFQIFYDLDYGNIEPIRQQLLVYQLNSAYPKEIAPARTFVTKAEAEALRARNLVDKNLRPGDVLVLDTTGPIDTQYRFADEPVRHKVLDLIGDFYLLGC